MSISFFSHWSFQYFYFCLTNHSKTMWNEATTLSYSQFWESENWVEPSKSRMFLIQNDWEYQVLEIAGDFRSFHSSCQTGSLILPHISLLELECPNSFFIHASGARAGESLIARADEASLSPQSLSSGWLGGMSGKQNFFPGAWLFPREYSKRDQSRNLEASHNLASHTMSLLLSCYAYVRDSSYSMY